MVVACSLIFLVCVTSQCCSDVAFIFVRSNASMVCACVSILFSSSFFYVFDFRQNTLDQRSIWPVFFVDLGSIFGRCVFFGLLTKLTKNEKTKKKILSIIGLRSSIENSFYETIKKEETENNSPTYCCISFHVFPCACACACVRIICHTLCAYV